MEKELNVDYYVEKFVYVFNFETSTTTEVLHTQYPKFLFCTITNKIQWLEKINVDNGNEESDIKLNLFEEVSEFVKNTKITIFTCE